MSVFHRLQFRSVSFAHFISNGVVQRARAEKCSVIPVDCSFFLNPLPYSYTKLLWCQLYRSITVVNKSIIHWQTRSHRYFFQFVCGLATFRGFQTNNSVAAVTSRTVLLPKSKGFSDIIDFCMTESERLCFLAQSYRDISASSCFCVFFLGSFFQQYLAELAF